MTVLIQSLRMRLTQAQPFKRLLATIACCALLIALGVAAPIHPTYALAAAAVVLLVGLFVADPTFLPVLAVPATLVVFRIGGGAVGGGTNLSVSDAVLFFATLCALPLVTIKDSPELRAIIGVSLLYQSAALLTVVDHPYRADIVEWFHRLMLVAGSLVVGWVVGNRGRARAALMAYVVGSCALALWAIPVGLVHHFHAAGLTSQLQKNFVGDMLAFAVLIAHINPRWVSLPRRFAQVAKYLCGAGIVAIDSRQAMVAVVAAVAICALRGRNLGRRSRLFIAASIPLAVIVYVTVSDELASSNRFNSAHQRITWYHLAWHLWSTSPIFGVGMRYYYTNLVAPIYQFQPPNAELETLVETGIVGLSMFLIMIGYSLYRTWNLPPEWGMLPFAVLLARVVQTQLDIFWLGAQGALPWLVVGIALGAMALHLSSSGDAALRSSHGSGAPAPPGPSPPVSSRAAPRPEQTPRVQST